MAFSGFKNTTFKTSDFSPSGTPWYKGRTICYENGRRLWQETSNVSRRSRGDALADAQRMAHDHLIKNNGYLPWGPRDPISGLLVKA